MDTKYIFTEIMENLVLIVLIVFIDIHNLWQQAEDSLSLHYSAAAPFMEQKVLFSHKVLIQKKLT